MTAKVIFRWNKYIARWLVLDHNEKEMMQFPDCGNLERLLKGLHKAEDNIVDFPLLTVVEYKEVTNG